MKRKGISPLIAAVLLIAFTMAVASIFAQWAPQLIQNAQGDTSNRSQEIQDCSSIILEFQQANKSSATVQQTGGDKNAGELTVTWFYEDLAPIQNNTKSIDNNRGFASYNVYEFNQSNIGTLSKLEASPKNCEGGPVAVYEP